MKKAIVCAGLFLGFLASTVYAQNGIVPPPGQSAQGTPPAASPVIIGNGINYYGGPVMVNPHHVYFIWYGNWSGNTALNILPDFINGLDASPYFSIDTTYTDGSGTPISNRVLLSAQAFDNYSQGTVLSAQAIQNVVAGAIQGGQLPADPDGIYLVLSAADVDMNAGFCTALCGFHTFNTIAGSDIKYGWVGNPDFCTTHGQPSCISGQQGSIGPNGNTAADGMANFMAHELNETVTDPHLNAWLDPSGAEVGDKCNFNFGSNIFVAPNGGLANVELGGRNFMIQQTWINSGGGMCAIGLSLVPAPAITSISPAQASRGTNAVPVTITGSNLFGATANSFKFTDAFGLPSTAISASNVQVAQDGSVISANLVVCGAPAGAYNLAIETANGTSKSQLFTITASGPAIRDTAPRSNAPGTSSPITVLGCALENTSTITAQTTGVSFININSTPTQVTATMRIDASAPPGQFFLSVTNPNGTSNSIFFDIVAVLPVLNGLSPSSQPAGSTFSLTLTGSNLANVSSVTFNPSAGITVNGISTSASQVTASVSIDPSALVGSYTVQVASPAGPSNGLTFNVGSNPGPTINNLSPASVAAGSPAFTLTVNGSGFVSGSTVQIGGSGRTTTFIGSTQLKATILASDVASAGNKSVTVANPPQGNTVPVSNAVTLTVTNPSPDFNVTVAPSSLSVTQGGSGSATVTVTSSNGFNALTSLSLSAPSGVTGSFSPAGVTPPAGGSASATLSLPVSSSSAAGTFPLTITGTSGSTSHSTTLTLTVTTANNPVPSISNISPSSVFSGGGDFTLTINGSGFITSSVVNVSVGNSSGPRPTTFVSPSQLTVQITSSDIANSGQIGISVTNPKPGGGTSNSATLNVF